jgi:hypothetical protein
VTKRRDAGAHARIVRRARVVAEFLGHEPVPEVGGYFRGGAVLGCLGALGGTRVAEVEHALLV